MLGITPEGRTGFAWGFAACVGGLVFAYYLQYFQDLEPCPMCIFQRIAMLGSGLGFALAMTFSHKPIGRLLGSALAVLSALSGLLIAARHVWLQGLPYDMVPACGPPLETLVNMMPWSEVFAVVLRGDGNCAIIDAAFLGLSLPGWTMLMFAGLIVWASLCGIANSVKR